MKTALVLGITGGFGSNIASALQERGWRIKALVRSPEKVSNLLREIEVIEGDAAQPDHVNRAAKDIDAIVYGLNMPYQHWHKNARPLLETTVNIAEEKKLLIVFPGNVYVFDPADGPEFTERTAAQPISEKGRVRAKMERRLLKASDKGARVLVIRSGDYFGKNATKSWLSLILIQRRGGYTLIDPTPAGHIHSWAYLVDLAAVSAELMENNSDQEAFDVFHYRGHRMSIPDIKLAIESQTGKPVKIKPFPWWLVKTIAPFKQAAKELLEMRYLWEQELHLNQQKLERALNKTPEQTPFSEALVQAGILN